MERPLAADIRDLMDLGHTLERTTELATEDRARRGNSFLSPLHSLNFRLTIWLYCRANLVSLPLCPSSDLFGGFLCWLNLTISLYAGSTAGKFPPNCYPPASFLLLFFLVFVFHAVDQPFPCWSWWFHAVNSFWWDFHFVSFVADLFFDSVFVFL